MLPCQVADFGLAKLVYSDKDNVVACTQLVGTFGYIAPEYCLTGAVSEKTDVFAFGVVLFELISCMASLDNSRGEPTLARLVRSHGYWAWLL